MQPRPQSPQVRPTQSGSPETYEIRKTPLNPPSQIMPEIADNADNENEPADRSQNTVNGVIVTIIIALTVALLVWYASMYYGYGTTNKNNETMSGTSSMTGTAPQTMAPARGENTDAIGSSNNPAPNPADNNTNIIPDINANTNPTGVPNTNTPATTTP